MDTLLVGLRLFLPFSHPGKESYIFDITWITPFHHFYLIKAFVAFYGRINYSRVKLALMENASPLTGLGFCSFLVLIAAFPYINTEYKWQSMTASIVSGASLLIIIFYLYKHQKESRLPTESFVVLLLLSLFWIFTAGVTTFSGPFLVTGNGYFASWGGAILSVVVTKDAYQDGINQTEIPPSPRFAETEEGTGPV